MEISEEFVKDILEEDFPNEYQKIYDDSMLLQYLDRKMRAVHGDSKTRRSLANIYAIYSILHFYKKDFFEDRANYRKFEGYDYMQLFEYYRGLYGGRLLQNHALNSRVNGEFHNKFKNILNDLIIQNDGKYLIHVSYIYVDGYDISKSACKIIKKYIKLLKEKDHTLIAALKELETTTDYQQKREKINALLTDDAEARIFEIISYAILKNHYRNVKVYFGYTFETIQERRLELYKTGRTNANDGGIDFVMRPIGRFFQVTEVNNYDKYLLDIDKVMHFPVSFVIKTTHSKESIQKDLDKYIEKRSHGMLVLERRYRNAIEEIITINELQKWMMDLNDADINNIIRDIERYYRLEMRVDEEDDNLEEDL